MDRSADSHPQSTLELVRKAQANDRAAFDLLVERHRYRLHSLITFRLGPSLRQRVEVEDVLQETYMKAFESIQGFAWRNEGSFFRWLTSIAQHVLQDFARRYLHTRRKKRPLEMSLSQDSPRGEDDPQVVTSLLQARSTSPSKAMQRNERFERLERALNTLSDDHREVILLARVHGLPIEEIAQQMDRSPDAVSMLLLRALRQLKKI